MSWLRVSKSHPCPICQRPDWCLLASDGRAACCQRIESPRPIGDAGWYHPVGEQVQPIQPPPATEKMKMPPGRVGEIALAAFRRAGESGRAELAEELGLHPEALRRLGVGLQDDHKGSVWTFPMKTAGGQVVGIRLRLAGGRKLSLRGGREALFIPGGLESGGDLWLPEGPTDCAAVLGLGLSAAGRPSCRGGVDQLVVLARHLRPGRVLVVSDLDRPGREGAVACARRLAGLVLDVRVVFPPDGHNDARAAVMAGATRDDFEHLADEAQPVAVRVRKRTT